MRLYLLPISSRRALIYAQRLNNQLVPKKSYLDRVTDKSAHKWAEWEEAPSGWKKTVTQYGNRALQHISFEEWGLKSIPPLSHRKKAEELEGNWAVEVVFPGTVLEKERVPDVLRGLATEKQSMHRRKMWWCLVGMPFTAPVALLPVIPNIPFFYLAFRCWSHWRALNGSKHTVFLLHHKLLRYTSSPLLDQIYLRNALEPNSPVSQGPDPDPVKAAIINETMLLTDSSGQQIAKALDFPEIGMEIDRAVRQAQKNIQKRTDLLKGLKYDPAEFKDVIEAHKRRR